MANSASPIRVNRRSAPTKGDVRASRRLLRKGSLRRVALRLHRYVGLMLAVFLIVSGVTGSLLAFHEELDSALNPQLFDGSSPSPDAQRLSSFELRELILELSPPGSKVPLVPLDGKDKEAVLFSIELPKTENHFSSDDEYFINPYTGALNGTRLWGDLRQGLKNLLPFIYRLHSSLALGQVGKGLLGIVALMWTFDCFVGAYLTLPVTNTRRVRRRGRQWFSRWRKAWWLRTTRLFSLVFTWHQASGLWVWGMLLVFAWSGVSLNLNDGYHPVMEVIAGPEQPYNVLQGEDALGSPRLSFLQAHQAARNVMAGESKLQRFVIHSERSLRYRSAQGLFEYRVCSSRDVSTKFCNTTAWIDANTGVLREAWYPTGESTNDTFSTWIYQLHFGTVRGWGWAHQVLVLLLGLVIALLSATGVWIWWARR